MKSHLASSSDPLKSGSTVETLCGEQVTHSEFILTIDSEVFTKGQMGDMYHLAHALRGICHRCMAQLLDKNPPGRYLYGLLDGQEFRSKGSKFSYQESA